MRTISRKDIKDKILKELPKGTEKMLKKYHGITGFKLRRIVNYASRSNLYVYGEASEKAISILEGDKKSKALPPTLSKTINEYLKLKDFDEKYAPSRLYNPKEIREIRELLGLTNRELSYETVGSEGIILRNITFFNKTGYANKEYLIHMAYHLNRLMDEKGISYE